jgi:hypothetical protein
MVTRTLEAKFQPETAAEAEGLTTSGAAPKSHRDSRLWSRRVVTPLVALNWTLAALLFIDLVGELIVYGTAYTLIAAIPAGIVFGMAAHMQSKLPQPSEKWLRIAGWTSAVLAATCLLSFYGSLMAPVDVACAFTSSIFGVAFAASAYYQLRLIRR